MSSLKERCFCLLVTLMVFIGWNTTSVLATDAGSGKLGSVDFPTTGSAEAQSHFLRGVAAMHSFWYEEALEEFRAATKHQPDFAMGYWGEAMTHNHPVWREQDKAAGRAALDKIKGTAALTDRERAYLDAVSVLYGEGDKDTRDRRYATAMAHVHQTYPDDLEAACFYALALLGTVPQSDSGFHRRIEAGALTLEIFQKSPDHPCAAHYAIHAFDHPDLAILGLPAARRYADIAPASHHAQHMPAHIFVQLGMWAEAARSNEKGWTDSVAWVARKSLAPYHRDYHSLHWLLYTRLQLGQYRRAAEVVALKQSEMAAAVSQKPDQPPAPGWEVHRFYAAMLAEWIIETEKWDSAESAWKVTGAPDDESSQAIALFVRGLSAAKLKQPEAESHLLALQALQKPDPNPRERYGTKLYDIWALELAAAVQASRGDYDQAVQSMKQAMTLEEALPPPSGPPAVLKPTHELLGEILLMAGRPKEAAQQFARSLQRQPLRARSVLGAARTAAQVQDHREAKEQYAVLREIYKEADDLPELREAREFK